MTMKGKTLFLLLIVVAIALPIARANDDEYEPIEDEITKGFVLVRRKVSSERPIADKPVTITIELYNSGGSPATQVQVTEETWPAEEFEVSGDLSAKFDTLSPGASLSHSYTLTPKGKVSTVQRPTIVTYVAEEKGKQLSTSSPWLPFQSFTNQDVLIIKALEAGSTITFGLLTTPADWIRTGAIFGGLLALVGGTSLVKTISAKRKSSKRLKAMKALGVDLKDE